MILASPSSSSCREIIERNGNSFLDNSIRIILKCFFVKNRLCGQDQSGRTNMAARRYVLTEIWFNCLCLFFFKIELTGSSNMIKKSVYKIWHIRRWVRNSWKMNEATRSVWLLHKHRIKSKIYHQILNMYLHKQRNLYFQSVFKNVSHFYTFHFFLS